MDFFENVVTPDQKHLPPHLLKETTLDEPVSETIARDGRRILTKLFHVLIPRTFSHKSKGVEALRDWDLWGPLIICLLLSVFLYYPVIQTKQDTSSIIFAASFVIIWLGSGIITVNAVLLGGNISFFQSVSIVGYCVFPLMVAGFICKVIPLLPARLIIVAVAFAWSIISSIGFFAGVVPPHRKILAMYPVFLFYIIISWMILLSPSFFNK